MRAITTYKELKKRMEQTAGWHRCGREMRRCLEQGSIQGAEDWFCEQLYEEGLMEEKVRLGPENMRSLRKFDTGAVRTADADVTRYDLISEIGLERLARTYAEGAAKYSDHNWRKGFPFSNLLNHAIAHLNKFKQGDTTEDHLAHAAFGLFALMEFQATRPELNDLYAYTPKEAAGSHDKAHIAHI